MGTQILAVGGVRMFRYALGTLLLLAGTALLVAKGLVWLDLEPKMLRALQGGALCALGTALGAVPVFFSLPATFLTGRAAATGFALACSLANIAGLVSNSLMGIAIDVTGSSSGALWFFACCLLMSCLLVVALPARLVNR